MLRTRSTRSGPRAAPVAPTELGEWSRGKLVAALVLVLVLALAPCWSISSLPIVETRRPERSTASQV